VLILICLTVIHLRVRRHACILWLQHVHVVTMSHCSLTDEGVSVLVPGLLTVTQGSIWVLDLRHNRIGERQWWSCVGQNVAFSSQQGCSARGSAKSSQTFTHFNEYEKCLSEFGQSLTIFKEFVELYSVRLPKL